MPDYATSYALTLPMLAIVVLDELRIAARHRRIAGLPVFLGPVRTEAFWLTPPRHGILRRASSYFRLGDMLGLFDAPLHYPLLDRFERNLSGAIWMLVADLRIVDGSSFAVLPDQGPVDTAFSAQDNDVAVVMTIDRPRGQFRLTAAVVN